MGFREAHSDAKRSSGPNLDFKETYVEGKKCDLWIKTDTLKHEKNCARRELIEIGRQTAIVYSEMNDSRRWLNYYCLKS